MLPNSEENQICHATVIGVGCDFIYVLEYKQGKKVTESIWETICARQIRDDRVEYGNMSASRNEVRSTISTFLEWTINICHCLL